MFLLLAILALAQATAAPTARAADLPPIRHVFVVVLENKDFAQTFGDRSPAPYLSRTLTAQGQLLEQYHGTTHASLGNYLAMISGQPSNPATRADCGRYVDVRRGSGCVYPRRVRTVADQLSSHGLTWKGYMQDMGRPCRHPAIGTVDGTQIARRGDQYATRHDPFVYFHSIIDDRAGCARHVVDLSRLPRDLREASTTPAFAFITPDLCEDGHDAPCVDGRPGGLAQADDFLRRWVPRILASPAYLDGGMLIVTFDEAESDSSGGGGRTGAVVLSKWTAAGSRNGAFYDHYALLRTVEDAFGLGHLGQAAAPGVRSFGSDVFALP